MEKKTMQESLQEGKTRVFLRELKHFDFKVFYMQERGVQTEVQMPGIVWKNLANLFDDHFRIQSIWKNWQPRNWASKEKIANNNM